MTNSTWSACQHDGPHKFLWNGHEGGSPVLLREIVETALHHVCDEDVEPGDMDTVRDLVARARAQYSPGATCATQLCIDVTDPERDAASRVLHEAASYMDLNGYADDHDFPEDAEAARVLGADGTSVLICWAPAFALQGKV